MCKVKSVRLKRADTWAIVFDCDIEIVFGETGKNVIWQGEEGTLNINQAVDEVAVFKKVANLIGEGKIRKAQKINQA